MKIIVHKCSSPGFSKEFESIKEASAFLESWICSSCLQTKESIEAYFEDNKERFSSDEDFSDELDIALLDALPEDFEKFSDYEKIRHYLSTACGLEFSVDFETTSEKDVVKYADDSKEVVFSDLSELFSYLVNQLEGEELITLKEANLLLEINPVTRSGATLIESLKEEADFEEDYKCEWFLHLPLVTSDESTPLYSSCLYLTYFLNGEMQLFDS